MADHVVREAADEAPPLGSASADEGAKAAGLSETAGEAGEADNAPAARTAGDAPARPSPADAASGRTTRARVMRTDDRDGDEESTTPPPPMDASGDQQTPLSTQAPTDETPEGDEAAVEGAEPGGPGSSTWLAIGGLAGLGFLGALTGGDDDGPPPNTAPTAGADAAAASEGGAAILGSVAANDADADGDPLTYTLGAPVAGLTLNANGTFSFDPSNAAYNGLKAGQTQAVTANYTVSDGRGGSASSILTITVTGTNDAPVTAANSYAAAEDTALTIAAAAGLLSNDVDPDGDALSAILVVGPAHGSLALSASGAFTYTPAANYNGPDSFTYRANDGTADGNTVTVTLAVTAVNDAPVATADTYAATEDTTLVVSVAAGVLANDTDVDGNPLTAALVAGPAHGAVVFNANGSFSYTPTANYSGSDSFTYRVNDGTVDGNTVTVSLNVAPVNDAPTSADDAYAATEDTPLVIAAAAGMLANDTDAEGNALTAVLVSGPANGSLTLNANGSFTYTPTANYSGADSFTYRANDGTANGNTATVSVTVAAVNDPPAAAADAYSATEDTTLVVSAAAGVLANDTDVDGDPLTAVLVAGPAHGSLALNANGSFSYTPTANYNGSDSFTYRVNDGTANGNTLTVSLNVGAVNDAPVAAADAYVATEDTPLVVAAAGVLANDTDVEGSALTAALVSGPIHGTLTLNPNGSFTYTPTANYSGPDSFTYRANDGSVSGNTVTVALTVAAVNDAPVAAVDAYAATEDATLVVSAAAGVLANDTDVDGDPLTAVLVAGPAHGVLVFNANGSFSYTPAVNYSGADSFTYEVNDGTVDGNTVTVSLNVAPVNDAPVAAADVYGATEDTPLVVAAGAGVLANDTDVEGDALTAVLVTGPTHGSLTLNANGSFTYTPTANYSGGDSFTYRPNDGPANGNTVTVSLNVAPVNDAPVSAADAYVVAEDSALTVTAGTGVLANDTDAEGASLTASLVTGPAHGGLVFNADGSFVYTPDVNYSGPDSFTYRANDGTANGALVTVGLTVTPVNDAPAATGDSYSVAEDATLVLPAPGVLGNDTDVDGDALSAMLVSGPAHGVLTLNPNGSLSYTPTADYTGPDSFTYKVNDGTVDGNTVTVSLAVTPANDPPVAVADSYMATEDTPLIVTAAGGLLANDTDVDGNPLTAVLVAGPSNGALTLNGDGSFTYVPGLDYSGPDSFTYRANDGTQNGNTVTVSLTVGSANDAPVVSGLAGDTATFVQAGPAVALDVGGDAVVSDIDSADFAGGQLSVSITANGQPAEDVLAIAAVGGVTVAAGVVSVGGVGIGMATGGSGGAALVIAFNADATPARVHSLLRALTYANTEPTTPSTATRAIGLTLTDGDGGATTVSTSVAVGPSNQPPVAAADSYTTVEDAPLTVAGPGVLGNDSDADGNPLTAIKLTDPANGSLTLTADGSFTYTPNANYAGPDSFTYKVNDGTADGNTVTVSLTVTPLNDAPAATADSYSIAEDGTLTVAAGTGVLTNDVDVDGNAITAVLVSGPAHAAAFALNANGSFNYSPTANYNGPDSFTYKINDGTVDGNTVTVSLTVTPANDAPVTVANSYAVNEDATLTVTAPGLLGNDTDIDGNALNAILVSGPAHGVLTANAGGSFTYTPTADYSGADSFTYKSNDGTADGNTVTVSLTVNPVNDAPVGVDDAGAAGEDASLVVNAASGVLANDTDIDGGTLTVSAVAGGTVGAPFALPSGALLTLNADGSYVYNPNGQFELLRPGQADTDSFTYTVSDGAGGTSTATAVITIDGANEAPDAVADSYNGVTGNTPYAVNAASGLLANDDDIDQPKTDLAVTHVNGVAIGGSVAVTGGSVVVNGDGSFVFTPATGVTGAASFSYTVTDADGGTDTATVTLNVTDQIWYVDANYAGGGSDGSYLRPFTQLTQLNGGNGDGSTGDDVDAANQTIFVFNAGGGATLTGGVTLEAGQKLFGDGHEFTVNGIQIGAAGVTSGPTINHSTYGVTLSTGNEVRGLTLNGTATTAVGIQDGGGTVGALTIAGVAVTGQGQIADIDQGGALNVSLISAASSGSTGGNGGVIDLTGVSGGFTVAGALSITGTHAQTAVDLTGNTGLTAAFNGATVINTGAQAAINLGVNTGSTTSFTAGLDIDTTSGTGLASAAGNTLSVSGGTNTVNTGAGQILNLADTVIGAAGMTFSALGASGTVANTAISLSNVDGAAFNGGAVNVAGTSGAGSDGVRISGGSSAAFIFASATINNTADEGIELNGANGAVTFGTVTIGGGAGGNGLEIVNATNAVNVNGGTITATGDAVNITGGTGAVTVAAALTKTTAGHVAEVNNHDAGAVLFSGALSSTGSSNGILVDGSGGGSVTFSNASKVLNTGAAVAVTLTNNTGGTIAFTGGGLDIDTTTGGGFTATGGGTVTVQGTGNTINASSGTALSVVNTTIGAAGLTFQSISSGAGANVGVSLDTTGSSGGLTVTGTGAAGSGGTIAGKTGADGSNTSGIGVYLNGTAAVSLNWVQLNDHQNHAIKGKDVAGFTLSNSVISGVNGTFAGNPSDFMPEGAITFGAPGTVSTAAVNGVTGVVSITNSNISGGANNNLYISNVSGTLNLTIEGTTIRNNVVGQGAAGITLLTGAPGNGTLPGGSAVVNATLNNNVFQDIVGSAINVVFAATTGSTPNTLRITNSVFDEGNKAIDVALDHNADLDLYVIGNTITDQTSHAIAFGSISNATNQSRFNATISNNIIGNGAPDSGSENGHGIVVDMRGDVDAVVSITGNTIRNFDINGILAQSRLDNDADGETGRMDIRIVGNTISSPDDNSAFPIGFVNSVLVEARNTTTVTALISGNTVGAGVGGAEAVRVRQRDTATFILEGLTDGDGTPGELINVAATIEGRVLSANPGAGTADATFVTGFVEGANGVTRSPPPPLLAAHAPTVGVNMSAGFEDVSAHNLEVLKSAAIARWAAAGATAEQLAAMAAITVSVDDLPGLALGSHGPGSIVIDDDAAGWGWFVDPTPMDDAEFAAGAAGDAAGRMDLLTALMHELGHQVGLDDHYEASSEDSLMYGFLDVGERHLLELDGLDPMAASSDAGPSAGLTGWITGSVPDFIGDGPIAPVNGMAIVAIPTFAAPPETAGVQGWVDGIVLESDTGGLAALLAGYGPSPTLGASSDAGAIFIDPTTLIPPPFDPVHPVM